ncbi:flagellar FliL protein [Anoxybacillus vitaminiphilus]|jgi:flagellar FliL protein|uniref:Flagellar protein FliL n=1 Tax=Paranoxybacillus vitaminiphilus TaxID=581036 RepID=A0A327YTH3_9BACL|nr:flagellar basal body-associated protein FliL [Anoxybacillus vitaminiphilus]RAK23377.1 flagellar FliL protein [Anoxybacillus vitaminiphilus]
MKNNKLLSVMLIIMVAITLISVVALVVIMKFTGDDETKEPTADEIVESSVDIPEITTNLADDHFIKVAFKLQTDSKKAKEEAEKRNFQIQNIIIEQLSEMKAEDFHGKQGKAALRNRLKEEMNKLMQEGKIVEVYITSFIIQ